MVTTIAAIVAFALMAATHTSAAAPLAINLPQTISTCSPATISWDASAGKAPWTITVAPVNGLPESVSVPANYMTGKTWSWDWNVPNFPQPSSQQVIVAISDSTGAVAGSSALQTLSAGTSTSCSAPPSALDFVWYPPERSPKACDDWKITWQEDKGNSGIVAPVQFSVIPENGAPTAYTAGPKDKTWDMAIGLSSGTRFVLVAFDKGNSGTGGVGQVYTVRRNRGSCSSKGVSAIPGLVAASTVATPSSKGSTSSSAGKSSKSTSTASSSKNGQSDDSGASSNDSSHSSTGAIAGGVVGGLAALALIAGLAMYFMRRRANTTPNQRRWPGGEIMPWKWEVVDEKSQDSHGGSHGGSASKAFVGGHLRRPSGDPNWPPGSMQHDMGNPQADSADMNHMSSSSGANPTSKHITKSSLSTRNVFSVVPDTALFPPPLSPTNEKAPTFTVGQRYQNLERPPQSKVVADSMLFPPPRQSGAVNGAAMTTRQLQEQSQALSQNPAGIVPESRPAPRQVYPQPGPQTQQSQSQAPPHRKPASPTTGGYNQPQRTDYVPPPQPISTSIHDPYSHMSRVYSPGTVQKTLHRRDFSEDTQGRLPPSDYRGARGVVDTSAKGRGSVGEEFVLPYLK